jgi:sec-independent protein translocase protein TatA
MAVGPWQLLIVALIILLLFGASRLSDIGKGLGEGIRNFKKGIADDSEGKPSVKSGDKKPVELPGPAETPADSKTTRDQSGV